ncbi:hypothetical protein [Actinoplanes sp. M2I2]|uniref:hypothetical protein n=1 Tax=Actinoplanes sp. M2I2 TaxID=1734444 RepID=UPI0020215A5E|nr:hypothetical protein [Actinoplanes sp. M2I2]
MPAAVEDDEPGFLASAGATFRLIVGWACVALGLLDLAMGLNDVSYVVFHVVLLITGLLLLGAGRIGSRLSGLAWAAGGLVAVLGLVGSTIPSLAVACCSRDYAVRHGFPFTMLARDPGDWRTDPFRSVADVLFWLCAGLIAMAVVAWLRPARPEPRRADASPVGNPPGHAEKRAYDQGASVRPSPGPDPSRGDSAEDRTLRQ